MELTAPDRRLIAALEDGLPLAQRPYRELGRAAGLDEADVIDRLASMVDGGLIKRLGVIVHHRELGYGANAMVVWDIPDARVDDVGGRFGAFDFVTLCYRRPRRPPAWPYNLFCMIHGREREVVLARIDELARLPGAAGAPREVLFSARRFKQRGAIRVGARAAAEALS